MALDVFFRRPWLAVVLALALRTLPVAYIHDSYRCQTPEQLAGTLALWTGDSDSYLRPIDNYIETGEYFWWNGLEKVRAGRMPHYGLPYWAARTLLDRRAAYDAVVLVQLAFDAVATVSLAALAFTLARSRAAAAAVFLLASANLLTATYALWLVPESLSLSALSVLLLAHYRLRESARPAWMALWGIALGCVICLKPYLSLLWIPLAVDFYKGLRQQGTRPLRSLGFLVLASFIAGAPLFPWMARNWFVFQRLVPFQADLYAGYAFKPAEMAARRFLGARGEMHMWWDKRSAGCYLFHRPGIACDVMPDESWLPEGYTLADLERARAALRALDSRDTEAQAHVAAWFDRMTTLYREEHPVKYTIVAPLQLAGITVFHSGSYFLPFVRETPCFRHDHYVAKLWQSAFYYFVLLAGGLGLVVLREVRLGMIAIPVYVLVLFSAVLRSTEFRYFDHALPGLLVSACAGLAVAWKRGRLSADSR